MTKEISLQNKTMNGVLWSAIQKVGSIAITFFANVILARLLTPADFGCIGMLMIFISLSNTFIDGGFGSALIQKKNPTRTDYSTIFYWNILLSIVLYGILYVSAPVISTFYKIPLLEDVLKVQGLVLIVNAFGIIQANQLRKQLDFKKISVVEIAAAMISLALAVLAAWRGLGVWSLIIQQISLSTFRTLFYWIMSKWRPIMTFSCKSFKDLFNFGGFILLSNLIGTLSNEIQGLFVGKMFSSSLLGYFTQSYRLEGSMATIISGIIDQVTFPVMAAIHEDKMMLIRTLKRFVQIPAFVCAPIMGLSIVIARPLITLIFGDQWGQCIPYFQILCSAGLAVCLQGASNNSISAIGMSKVLFKWTLFKRSATIIFCVGGILLAGMYGLLWACALGAWFVYVVNAYLVEKYIGYSLLEQVKDVLPFVSLATVVGCIVFYVGTLCSCNEYATALVQVVLYTFLYVFSAFILKFEIAKYLLNVIVKNKK